MRSSKRLPASWGLGKAGLEYQRINISNQINQERSENVYRWTIAPDFSGQPEYFTLLSFFKHTYFGFIGINSIFQTHIFWFYRNRIPKVRIQIWKIEFVQIPRIIAKFHFFLGLKNEIAVIHFSFSNFLVLKNEDCIIHFSFHIFLASKNGKNVFYV